MNDLEMSLLDIIRCVAQRHLTFAALVVENGAISFPRSPDPENPLLQYRRTQLRVSPLTDALFSPLSGFWASIASGCPRDLEAESTLRT